MEKIKNYLKRCRPGFTLSTPKTILLGFILLTATLGFTVYSGFKTVVASQEKIAATNQKMMLLNSYQQAPTEKYNLEAMLPITSDDHIKGNPKAKVKIVEYSDTECPFCKSLHTTMNDLIKEYGNNGDVAWVYRHMPIPSLHKKAQKEAEATECAEEIAGKDAFWRYLDRLMEITPSNDGLESSELMSIAKFIGINVDTFTECLNSGRMAAKVNAQSANGSLTGSNGTPWSIVVGPNVKLPLSGAQPIESIRQLIDIALKSE
jgi:protein-disulfide isomerase